MYLNCLLKRISPFPIFINRSLSCTPTMQIKQWYIERGLPPNRNAEGVLTDKPDYSFLDGRPTPLMNKQKKRMLEQQQFASQIVQLSAELDFAKKRRQDIVLGEKITKENVIKNRLKEKRKSFYQVDKKRMISK